MPLKRKPLPKHILTQIVTKIFIIMKKTLIFILCNIFLISTLSAGLHPIYKKYKGARTANGKAIAPKPPQKIRR